MLTRFRASSMAVINSAGIEAEKTFRCETIFETCDERLAF